MVDGADAGAVCEVRVNSLSFPQFALLPPELQLKVWTYSLPRPRIVDFFAVTVSESLQQRSRSDDGIRSITSSSLPRIPAPISNVGETILTDFTAGPTGEPPATLWLRTIIERIYSSPQALSCLHICSAARRVALKKYVCVNADLDFTGDMEFKCLPGPFHSAAQYYLSTQKGSRPYALFDSSCDILFLQDPPRTVDRTGGPVMSSLETLLRWCPVEKQRLKRLALPYYTWRKTRNNGRLGLLRDIGLEEVWVSFLGDCYAGSRGYRATWSDVVGGLWSHVKEVEDEVRADVEGLKRSFPGWKVPNVRVIKHRGLLMEEFEVD